MAGCGGTPDLKSLPLLLSYAWPYGTPFVANYSLQWAIAILKPTRFFAQPSRFFH